MRERWWIVGGLGGGLAVLAACAVPNLVEARKHGNEAAAVGALKTVQTAQSLFREGDKENDGQFDYAGVAELSGQTLIDGVLGGGTKRGYAHDPGRDSLWAATANPAVPTATGDRYFATNQAGVVFYEQSARIAPSSTDCQIPEGLLPVGKGGGPASPVRPDFAATRGEGLRSTIALEVDSAAYVTLRQALVRGTLPAPESVRIEELLNAFEYGDPAPPPTGACPLAARVEVSSCPWRQGHQLVRIGIRARELSSETRPPTSLVLLVDASGARELQLVREGIRLLARQLGERDRVSIVLAGSRPRVVLSPTGGARRTRILEALDRLEAAGPGRTREALDLAHDAALRAFRPGGANRILLLSDGRLDPGPGGLEGLAETVAQRARSGVALTAIGLGSAPSDATLARLARSGNGQHLHLDSLAEARRVFVEQLAGTSVTVAAEVKAQVVWDPARVRSWRLIGHEDARLAARDFRDDRKGGGELGAGHSVVLLWEVEPIEGAPEGPLGTLGVRWRPPGGGKGREALTSVRGPVQWFEAASADLRFTAAVAALGMLLRGRDAGNATLEWIRATADAATSGDPRRVELVELVEAVRSLRDQLPEPAPVPRTSGMAELADAGLIDGILGSGVKQGYRFEFQANPDGFRWMATASPVVPTTTGDRWFVTNHTGVVHYSSEGPFALNDACEIPAHAIPVGK